MKIDERVESVVRDLLEAAIKRDPTELETALTTFHDDGAIQEGVSLALAIAAYIVAEIHGGKPNDAQVRAIAEKVATMEKWAGPTADEVHALLSRLLNSEALTDAMPTETVIVLTFVVTASLLASLHLEGENWWNYLDRIEAVIETR